VSTPPKPGEQAPAAQKSARSQMIMGAMLVMGACVFGGLTAVVLTAIGQKTGAGIIAILSGVIVLVGIVIQVIAMRKLKAALQDQPK
jgi:drug/metabolite transporter (DMT)-like permease